MSIPFIFFHLLSPVSKRNLVNVVAEREEGVAGESDTVQLRHPLLALGRRQRLRRGVELGHPVGIPAIAGRQNPRRRRTIRNYRSVWERAGVKEDILIQKKEKLPGLCTKRKSLNLSSLMPAMHIPPVLLNFLFCTSFFNFFLHALFNFFLFLLLSPLKGQRTRAESCRR